MNHFQLIEAKKKDAKSYWVLEKEYCFPYFNFFQKCLFQLLIIVNRYVYKRYCQCSDSTSIARKKKKKKKQTLLVHILPLAKCWNVRRKHRKQMQNTYQHVALTMQRGTAVEVMNCRLKIDESLVITASIIST